MYARPGYAGSTARPGRTVADATGDVAALLDELGAQRFVTIGWSGGGPHALACGTLLAGRCVAAGVLAGVAPYRADGLDWMAGMGAGNVAEFGAALAGEEALTKFLAAEAPGLAHVRAADVAAALGDLVSDVDIAALTGDFAGYLAASFRAAVSGGPTTGRGDAEGEGDPAGDAGIAGWRDDDLAFVRGWGFRPAATAPTVIWQGDRDRMVPYAHGEWLAAHVTGARAHLLPGEGHLSLIGAYDSIVAEIAELACVPPPNG